MASIPFFSERKLIQVEAFEILKISYFPLTDLNNLARLLAAK